MKKCIPIFFPVLLLLVCGTTLSALDLVRDGKICAEIITVQPVSAINRLAAKDLQYHIEQMSGAKLPIVNKRSNNALAAIYVGKNDGIELKDLGRNGFVIKCQGNELTISGLGDGTAAGIYYLLENNFNCHWLWPGKSGEIIPKQKTLSLKDMTVRFKQPVSSSRIHTGVANAKYWQNKAMHKQFYDASFEWMRRMGFSWDTTIRSQHAFNHPGWQYSQKYFKSNPEYFQMLPDGTRRPDPNHAGGSLSYIGTCPSSEGLLNQALKDWEEKRHKGYPFGPNLFLGENDSNGNCCCEKCLAADRSNDPNRLAKAKELFLKGDAKWVKALGDVSERYAVFYMKGLERAKKIAPEVKVIGWAAYGNYMEAPRFTKFNKDVVLCFVGDLMYPWTDAKVKRFKQLWLDWSKSGASLVLRPNFMLDGHCMPVNYARKFYDVYKFCLANGMIGVEFDSNIGQYASNGFNYYVMARMLRNPQLSFETIKKEYCDGFGAASKDIAAYLDLCEKISDSADTVNACNTVKLNPVGVEVGSWNYFYTKSPIVYTEKRIKELQTILNRAEAKVKNNIEFAKRVKFLQNGLKNAELTLEAQRIHESGNKLNLASAVDKLDKFRSSVEADLGCNRAHLARWEDVCWERTSLKFLLNAPGKLFNDNWKLKFDPENKGMEQKWFAPDFSDADFSPVRVDAGWERQPIGIAWKKAHKNSDYDGFGWYRNTFNIAKEDIGKKVQFTFGAVDESCTVWVNGKQILDRPFPYKGDKNSWSTAFSVDASDIVVPGKNVIVVRVGDKAGQGGIWRNVWLKISVDYNKNKNLNLIKNGGFEDKKLWSLHTVHGKFKQGVTSDIFHSGKQSGFLECIQTKNGNNLFEYAWMRTYQTVKVEPGKNYFFRIFYRTRNFSSAAQVRIWILGKKLRHEFIGTASENDWCEVVIPKISIPAGTDNVTVYLNVLGGKGLAAFDDAEMKEL